MIPTDTQPDLTARTYQEWPIIFFANCINCQRRGHYWDNRNTNNFSYIDLLRIKIIKCYFCGTLMNQQGRINGPEMLRRNWVLQEVYKRTN